MFKKGLEISISFLRNALKYSFNPGKNAVPPAKIIFVICLFSILKSFLIVCKCLIN